jgi:hypothetical protein
MKANGQARLPVFLLAALLAWTAAATAFPWRSAEARGFVNGARVDGAEPGEWTHDWEAAAEAAKRTGMPVFALFTGSDWCPWCKILDRQVFAKEEWRAWARENVYLVRVDFPRNDSLVPEKHRARNREVARRYGIGGYPTCLLLEPASLSPVGRFGASRDVDAADFVRRVAAAVPGKAESGDGAPPASPTPPPDTAPVRTLPEPAAAKPEFEIKNGVLRSMAANDIETVVVPEGVHTVCLDGLVFGRTKSVVIPEGVESLSRQSGGYRPGVPLEKVALPASLRSIRPTAFDGHWRKLARIEIADGSPYRMEDGFLIDTRNASLVFALPGRNVLRVPPSVDTIGDWAFNANDATEIAVPEGVETIGRGAFDDCRSLERLSIPASVAVIGDDAFANCGKLVRIEVAEGNPRYAVRDGLLIDRESGTLLRAFGPMERVVVPEEVRTIGEDAFSFQKSLVSLVVPPSVRRIEDSAFSYCTALEELQLPEEVDFCGDHLVMGCSSLGEIRLPRGLERLAGTFSFGGCSSLRELAFPEGLRSIGAAGLGAVCRCGALERIVLPASVERIDSGRAFLENPRLEAFEVHPGNPAFCSADGVLFSKDMTRLVRCPEAKTGAYEIPDTVVSIDASAFAGCRHLESIRIPDGVESAGRDAFKDCPARLSRPVPETPDPRAADRAR